MSTIALCLLWYSMLSFTSQITKVIMTSLNYPFFLAMIQFAIATAASSGILCLARRFPKLQTKFPSGTLPDNSSEKLFNLPMLAKILPLSIFNFSGKYFSLSATLLIPVATVASVKSLTPLVVVLGYRTLYQVRFPAVTYALLVPLVAGVVLMIGANDEAGGGSRDSAPLSFLGNPTHVKGIAMCIISTLVLAAQQMYGKELITWAPESSASHDPASLVLNTDASPSSSPELSPKIPSRPILPVSASDTSMDEKKDDFHVTVDNVQSYDEEVHGSNVLVNPFAVIRSALAGVNKPDKFTVVCYISATGLVLSAIGFAINEAPSLNDAINDAKSNNLDTLNLRWLLALAVLSGMAQFSQMVLAFVLLGCFPALSFSIASMMKRIVIIVVSIIVAGRSGRLLESWQAVTGQITGLVFIALGLVLYDQWGSRSLKSRGRQDT